MYTKLPTAAAKTTTSTPMTQVASVKPVDKPPETIVNKPATFDVDGAKERRRVTESGKFADVQHPHVSPNKSTSTTMLLFSSPSSSSTTTIKPRPMKTTTTGSKARTTKKPIKVSFQ